MTATTRILAAIAVALAAGSGVGAANAAQTTLGFSNAQLCFQSATVASRTDAIEICTAAINRNGLTRADLAATYSNRGILWAANGQLDRALEDHNRAVNLTPDSPRALVNRANVRYRLREFNAALEDYSRAIELSDGAFAPVFYNRALVHRAIGDSEAARADLERAIALAPDNVAYREILATLH